jgi:hypothetical protein
MRTKLVLILFKFKGPVLDELKPGSSPNKKGITYALFHFVQLSLLLAYQASRLQPKNKQASCPERSKHPGAEASLDFFTD